MADIRATKSGFVVSSLGDATIRATKGGFFALINFPTEFIEATKAGFIPVAQETTTFQASKAGLIAVVKGRTSRSVLAAWTFEIDGHSYYVLQLQEETLIYDFHSERWYVWGSGDDAIWNVQLGQNWNANLGFILAELGGEKISNVVAGDGTTSALYFLDPTLSEDYSSFGVAGKAFRRVITGQLVSRGRKAVKLPGVEVSSSEGNVVAAADMSVTLEISDDQGHTYWSAGSRTIVEGTYATALDWRSLGSFRAPGRLLRLVDYGAIRRVDDWTYPKDENG